MSQSDMTAWGRGHAVSFYALDTEGVDSVAHYVAQGWTVGECVIVVATRAHRAAIEARLRDLGHDPAAQLAQKLYLPYDAETTLRSLLSDGSFDVERFHVVVGAMLQEAAATGAAIRAFGEMVALMWQLGAVDDAIELEMQWNRLMHDHDFSLLCAYPTGVFDHATLVDVRRVCELHTDVVPPATPADTSAAELAVGHACSRIYLPIPESVPAARHFVVDVLRSWGNDDLTGDAALIISELATNALSHAMSPFRAVLDRRGQGLRIGVEDATDIALERRSPPTDATSGRGVAIIEALSERWGYSAVPGGKVVWAELPLRARRWQAG
ncbi:hypothetical protein GCM10027053_46000 [Intrasporangium mesophilum]